MFVTVHKEGYQWFRDDNGALVGKNVAHGKTFNRLNQRFNGERFFWGDAKFFIKSKKDEYFAVYYGFFNQNGNFIPFCTSSDCSKCIGPASLMARSPLYCRQIHKSQGGYYIIIP